MAKKIIVTGAGGFLGGRTAKHIADLLKDYEVIATARKNEKEAELEKSGCTFSKGDLTDKEFCMELCDQAEIVIHCAALSSPYGPYEEFYKSNVITTQNLLECAKQQGVKKFIFISTPSIYFNFQDRFDVKESDLLPKKMVNHYAQTKLIAENLILTSNSTNFKTIALRPRAIIGEGDTVIFPRVLEAYNQGRLKIVGDGKNICDLTCVRNVVEAIVCAIHANEDAHGQAYNITDGKPEKFWEVISYAFEKLNLKIPSKKVPYQIASLAGTVIEWKANFFKQKKEPALTKYGIGILAKSFTLDISKAKVLLGYQPIQTTYEGIDEFIQWYKKK